MSAAKRGLSAELLPDRGLAAASEEDFFRCRPFLEAEGVTHTLRIEAGDVELSAPLLVREIPGGGGARDAVSPYGYPGFAARGRSSSRYAGTSTTSIEPLDPSEVDFSAAGLVSVFVRHALGEPPLAGARRRASVQVADPALPRKQRSSDRNQINKNRRNGYEVRLVPGPETSPDQRAAFLTAYEQTMRRAGAGERYFFGAAYFDRVLEFGQSWLALAEDADGTVAAASIATAGDGFLHYYLSGSLDSHLRDSPMKNVVAALVDHTTELELPLNLGGGIVPGDALEDFKRGFANRELPWCVSEIVCDPSAYERLSTPADGGLAGESGFFPAYRRPG